MERLPRRTPTGDLNLLGMVFDALADAVEDIPIIGDIVGFVASLFGNSSASNARIARLETIVSKGSSGYDDFNRSDSGSLGRGPQMTVDWVTGGDGQALGVQGRAAGLVEALAPADGRRWARYPTPASSSTMTADTIVDDKKVDNRACTSVIVAANAAFTEFVYANVFGTGVYLGRGTRSGNAWSFNDWKSNTSYKVGTAERVEVRASGSGIYQLVVDNTVILEHTDTTYPIDSDHRYVGFAIQCWTGILQLPEYGWRLSAFSLKSEAGTFTAIEAVETVANNAVETAVTQATNAANAVVGTVQQNLDTAVAQLNNRIDEVTVGGASASRAFFATSGTWTKPAGEWSRHVIDVIGGGSGGGRGDTTFGDNGVGGWVGGWAQAEFFDSDLPNTLTVTVGAGGIGATTNGAQGGNGGGSSVVGYLSAGGGTGSFSGSAGFGAKTITSIRGGVGGRSSAAASAGTGHDYASGGAAGTGPGGNGGDGNTPTPSTKAYPGTGGGGGSYVNTINLNGGNGGNGGFPGGPGGGGAAPGFNGSRGNGGNGAGGGVWITSYK